MAGLAALGTKLKYTPAGGTAVVIANVTSLDGPGMSLETLDMTTHDSGGSFREIAPSFLDGGELSLTLNFDPAGATHKNAAGGLLNVFITRTLGAFQLVFPNAAQTTWSFNAYVTKFSPSAPFDGKLEASCTLKLSGAPTLA